MLMIESVLVIIATRYRDRRSCFIVPILAEVNLLYPPPRRPDRRGLVKERELISFIERTDFPCVGAKSALNQGGLYVLHARLLTSAWNDVALHSAIVRFTEEHANRKRGFRSLIILFDGPLSLARKMLLDHTTAKHQMSAALEMKETNGVSTPPQSLDTRHEAMLKHLSDSPEDDFDTTYLNQQVLAHEETVSLMRNYADNGDNPQLRSQALGTLPVVERHLDEAKMIKQAAT